MTADKPLLICLMGPTASGKTDLAIDLAQQLGCELVSVDSVLVYRGMDIGTAKPAYPHHLVDIRDPAQAYSVADFVADAERLAADIAARGKIPLLVGGTMLYFKAFLDGMAAMPPADPAIRAEIAALAAARGWPHVHQHLALVDPQAAARIHPHHSQRLSRALEIYQASGVTLTEWHHTASVGVRDRWRVVQLALCPAERSLLHARIAQRFALMMEAGLLEEVSRLWQHPGLHTDLPAIRAVGYRQLWRYLEGESSLEDAVKNAIAATRQLAKRQLTWLRKWPELEWIYTDHAGNLTTTGLSEEYLLLAGEKPLALALNYLGRPPL